MNPTVILAHAGGWDESLMALGPLLVLLGFIVVARRRPAQQHDERERDTSPR